MIDFLINLFLVLFATGLIMSLFDDTHPLWKNSAMIN